MEVAEYLFFVLSTGVREADVLLEEGEKLCVGRSVNVSPDRSRLHRPRSGAELATLFNDLGSQVGQLTIELADDDFGVVVLLGERFAELLLLGQFGREAFNEGPGFCIWLCPIFLEFRASAIAFSIVSLKV